MKRLLLLLLRTLSQGSADSPYSFTIAEAKDRLLREASGCQQSHVYTPTEGEYETTRIGTKNWNTHKEKNCIFLDSFEVGTTDFQTTFCYAIKNKIS